jgi:hypothetical protein
MVMKSKGPPMAGPLNVTGAVNTGILGGSSVFDALIAEPGLAPMTHRAIVVPHPYIDKRSAVLFGCGDVLFR